MTAQSSPIPYPPASARNMALLVQLRWMAVVGQLLTIWVVTTFLQVRLPLQKLIVFPALLALVNLATMALGHEREGYSYVELLGALMIDVMALAWQLYFSGGTTNPFAFLFLLQIVIGAILLPPNWSWIVAVITVAVVATLTYRGEPLQLPPPYQHDPMRLYLQGSLLCFALIAGLLMFFVINLDRNRRQSDAALATLRQQAAEEHHIVRMGLLASGAAHELGTPMATMSVILGDWSHHPAIAGDDELAAELDEMQAQLRRCKTTVTGILMSAGEARGENPKQTSLHSFVADIGREWEERSGGAVCVDNAVGEDVVVVADPALRQVLGHVIENALEVSPRYVLLTARLVRQLIVLEVCDRGPGFAEEMLQSFGRPYSSTKGRSGGGLGLFLVVNVVRKLGGKVEVGNPEQGGARVRISIPLRALAPAGKGRA